SSRDELLHAATKHMAELYARTDAGRGRGLVDEGTLLARHWGEMADLVARGELRMPDTAMAASASGLATNGQHFHDRKGNPDVPYYQREHLKYQDLAGKSRAFPRAKC